MCDIIPIEGGICAVDGIFCDGVSAGLKRNNKLDVAFIYSQNPLSVEAIFTSNTFQAAPIRHYLECVKGKESNFFLINTKNANAMTGERGIRDAKEILESLCARFPHIQNPIMSSTGVIGQYLPKETIINAFVKFDLSARNHANAANAILTTDRFIKEIALRVDCASGTFHIGAMAKGAGMIAPAMATMLCFIVTDAAIPQSDMGELLRECAGTTFNAISVDGDTSTNDSVFLATTRATNAYDRESFKIALEMIMKKLALDILKDGEGSSKIVAFEVKNAASEADARKAAKALANSLLVKTALFGGDPNWGRIASTIGACGIKADTKTLSISIGETPIFSRETIYFENEAAAAKTMEGDSFKITCDLGQGSAAFTAWGCDLGHQYVDINSAYRS